MKLAYFWVEEYLNIYNQGFNFGSEWLYKYEYNKEEDTLHIDRLENDQYVSGFFKYDNSGFEIITAIVGENGVGKTNLLSCMFDHSLDIKAIFIFELDGKSIVINRDIFLKKNNFNNYLKVIASFEAINSYMIENTKVVYYSPIYDFNNTISSLDGLINISSNYLVYKDVLVQKSNDKYIGINAHKNNETKRKINFLKSLEESELSIFREKLYFPDRMFLKFEWEKMPSADTDLDNLSLSFREFVETYLTGNHDKNFFGIEINDINSEKYEFEKKVNKNRITKNEYEQLNNLNKWNSYLWLLRSLIASLIKNAQKDPGNHLLNKEVYELFEKVDTIKYNKISYLTYSSSNKSNFEEFVFVFFENQDIFFEENIIPIIYFVKKLIFQYDTYTITSNNDVVIEITFDLSIEFINLYDKLLAHFTYIENIPMSWGFADFQWEGMSSGELSYLTLFSRLFEAYTQLGNNTQIPERIILLLDEGESGFHVQWQKEYIDNLIRFVPQIFKLTTDLQLIFTSHSPISLSDLPRNNIILLKKENNQTRSVDAKEAIKASFGANIHDLLISSFFMKDGFTGRFSQQKINDIIYLLNEEKDDNETNKIFIKAVIDVIDEPILSLKLREMYNQKYLVNSEKENIINYIEYLQKRLNEMEG